MSFKIITRLRKFVPLLILTCIIVLLVAVKANADSANFFTSCINNKGVLYNAQLGTAPLAPCKSGDAQVYADYGDITGVTAGTGLTGGATQGVASVSVAAGGISTGMLADNAVTVTKLIDGAVTSAKISSGTATAGQVLTATGSGGVAWQTPTGGSASWGSITGILSNQTDLQSTLDGKQDKIVSFIDRHTKDGLNSNADNGIFSFPLADGDAVSFYVYYSLIAKKGSDVAIDTDGRDYTVVNSGGTLYFTGGSNTTEWGGDNNDNGGSLHSGVAAYVPFVLSINSGVVTAKLHIGDYGSIPDDIKINYVLISPDGTVFTQL